MPNTAGSGTATLRELEGNCDWCGDECHANSELCVVMSCNRCDDSGMYHQRCLEKFLKQYGFPSSRKVGFPCLRGRGKGTACSKECPGRIEKSHPIIPKNEEKKKKALPPPMSEVMGTGGPKQQATKQQNGKATQQAAKPSIPARKLAHPKPCELSGRFGSSNRIAALVPSAWHNAEGVNPAVREAPTDPVDSAYTTSDADEPRSAHVPVGLVLEEAMTKAQKKNLARRKKKQQVTATDGQHSEAGTAVTDGSADPNNLDEWALADQPCSSAHADHNLLAGHTKFVTDPVRYLQLLGLMDTEDESEHGGMPEVELGSPATSVVLSISDSGSNSNGTVSSEPSTTADLVPVVVPIAVPVALPLLVPDAASPPLPPVSNPSSAITTSPDVNNTVDDDTALLEAMELSKKQYQLEQEMEKQRMVLAGQVPLSKAALALAPTPSITPSTSAPPTFSFPHAPTLSPSVVTAPVQHVAPIMLPKLELPSTTLSLESKSLPMVQDVLHGASNGGNHGPNPATLALAPSNGVLQACKVVEASKQLLGAYAPLTSGHKMVDSATKEEDDLGDLLALCGVVN